MSFLNYVNQGSIVTFGTVGRMVIRAVDELGRRSPRIRRFYSDLVFDLSGE